MSSASNQDQVGKEIFCYYCCCRDRLFKEGGVRAWGIRITPYTHHIWLSFPQAKIDRPLSRTSCSKGVSEETWQQLNKIQIQIRSWEFLFCGSMAWAALTNRVWPSDTGYHHKMPLIVLLLKNFLLLEDVGKGPCLPWMFSSQWNITHYEQQLWKNTTSIWRGEKCSFAFARTKRAWENRDWSCKTQWPYTYRYIDKLETSPPSQISTLTHFVWWRLYISRENTAFPMIQANYRRGGFVV